MLDAASHSICMQVENFFYGNFCGGANAALEEPCSQSGVGVGVGSAQALQG